MPFISEMVKPTSHLFLLKWTRFLMRTHGKKLQQPPWGGVRLQTASFGNSEFCFVSFKREYRKRKILL